MDYKSLLREISINKKLNIVYDSRKVKKGDIFVCIKGFKTDGHDYVLDAIKKGASIIVSEKSLPLPREVSSVIVEKGRQALAELSAEYYNHPSKKLNLYGITGTNGKTTVTYMIDRIMQQAGLKTGLIGTLGISMGGNLIPSGNTTPESYELQKIFSHMVETGIEEVAMEVSSHALELYRVWNSYFTGVIYTNFSRDHLDFHSTLEDYWKTKASFLSLQKKFGSEKELFSVFNGDDPEIVKLIPGGVGKKFVYSIKNSENLYSSIGFDKTCLLCASELKLSGHGSSFKVKWQSNTWQFKLKLMGMFNIYNALAAICTALGRNIDMTCIIDALSTMEPVRGRIYPVSKGQDFTCIVDYAHTPDGLEKVLSAAREFTEGRVITVFGCGGDRDRTKRPLMGQIGFDLSDYVILTSDNPRSENPADIIKDIEKGMDGSSAEPEYSVEPDRKIAIEKAIDMASAGDCVVVAGKGHEDYQIFSDKTIYFDDSKVIEDYLELITGRK